MQHEARHCQPAEREQLQQVVLYTGSSLRHHGGDFGCLTFPVEAAGRAEGQGRVRFRIGSMPPISWFICLMIIYLKVG